jgi:hypothetical protein
VRVGLPKRSKGSGTFPQDKNRSGRTQAPFRARLPQPSAIRGSQRPANGQNRRVSCLPTGAHSRSPGSGGQKLHAETQFQRPPLGLQLGIVFERLPTTSFSIARRSGRSIVLISPYQSLSVLISPYQSLSVLISPYRLGPEVNALAGRRDDHVGIGCDQTLRGGCE